MLSARSESVNQGDAIRGAAMRPLSGWGGAPTSIAEVVTPSAVDQLGELVMSDRTVVPRGLGRSYGDAAQSGGGRVIDMTGITGLWLDAKSGIVTADAGTSLGRVIDTVLPNGWFLPVTPGTRHVTVGGAIAADIHGKNHHRHGSFSQHTISMELVTGDGRVMIAKPGDDAFMATVGGMGLTGLIKRATFQLVPVESAWMRVDSFKGADLETVMEILAMADDGYTYSVAWVDLTRSGRGRGVVTAAEHATHEEAVVRRALPAVRREPPGPPTWMPRVVSNVTVDLFNRAWFWHSTSGEGKLESLDSFFYPLDRLTNWNRLYGHAGFLQYQFVVPEGAEDTLSDVAETLVRHPTPVSLAVLKRMGPTRGGMISFPMPGWTLAVDLPLGDPGLATVLDSCDRSIAACGGRVYLAKDSRLRADVVQQMYPNLERWRRIRSDLDPERRFGSDLSQRLALCG